MVKVWKPAAVLAALCLFGVLAGGAGAEGVLPGAFQYKLHATVPLLVEEEFENGRTPDVNGLRSAEFVSQAGQHADMSVMLALKAETEGVLDGTDIPEAVVTELPPGPTLALGEVPPCPRARFLEGVDERPGGCPADSQIGVANALFGGVLSNRSYPLYKLAPAAGHMATIGFPYELLFQRVGIQMNLDPRADGDYGLNLSSSQISFARFVPAPFLTIWGVPGAPTHDSERWDPQTLTWGSPFGGPVSPLVANAADCESGTREARVRMRYWDNPEHWLPEDPENIAYRSFAPQPEGCERLAFAPEAELSPSSGGEASPAGIDLRVRLPRDPDPAGLETPPLREAALTLPPGMSLNPAAADGLAACTPEQIGLEGEAAAGGSARFSAAPASCPPASRIGTAKVETSLAEAPLEGALYFAAPFQNPFDSPLALYLVLPGPGFTAKLPVEVTADPGSGRLTARIASLPQLPVRAVQIDVPDGPRAPLLPPPGCGRGQADLALTPWSAPASGPPAELSSSYGYSVSGCAEGPPQLSAGSLDSAAGASSPFVLHLRDSAIGAVSLSLPPGLLARFGEVPACGEGEIARAEAREGAGGGVAERRGPSCPASSRVGSVTLGLGSGPSPLAVGGDLYLAGPYAGAPRSLVAIVPAVAGGSAADPLLDLGTVVSRIALGVDRRSGALTAGADLPRLLDGMPLRVGSVDLSLDRPGLMRNPTRCTNMLLTARVQSPGGTAGTASTAFRAGGCARLPFAPRPRLALGGGGRPDLRLGLRAKPGEAASAAARFLLPAALGLDRRGLRGACSTAATGRGDCRSAAVRGRASASSGLLGRLEGPVYLRSLPNGGLGLTLALGGEQPLEISARVRRADGRVSIDFPRLPDLELTKLDVDLRGGRRGILARSGRLCGPAAVASARLVAPDGAARSKREPLGGSCPTGPRRSRPDRQNTTGMER